MNLKCLKQGNKTRSADRSWQNACCQFFFLLQLITPLLSAVEEVEIIVVSAMSFEVEDEDEAPIKDGSLL